MNLYNILRNKIQPTLSINKIFFLSLALTLILFPFLSIYTRVFLILFITMSYISLSAIDNEYLYIKYICRSIIGVLIIIEYLIFLF